MTAVKHHRSGSPEISPVTCIVSLSLFLVCWLRLGLLVPFWVLSVSSNRLEIKLASYDLFFFYYSKVLNFAYWVVYRTILLASLNMTCVWFDLIWLFVIFLNRVNLDSIPCWSHHHEPWDSSLQSDLTCLFHRLCQARHSWATHWSCRHWWERHCLLLQSLSSWHSQKSK